MANIKGCFSHQTDEWSTPSNLYKAFLDQGFLDPCPKGAKFDGLKCDFHNLKLYVNPPFSNLSDWVKWCIIQYLNGCDVWLLMPSLTDTQYFHSFFDYDVPIDIFFLKGRLHFNDNKIGAPFPTMLVHISTYSEMTFTGCTLEQFINGSYI